MESALNDFRELLAVETAKIDRSLAETLNKTISLLASKGNLQSSAGMILITRNASDTIPMHCQTAFVLLLRSLTAHGIQVDQSNKDTVIGVLRAWIKGRLLQLREVASQTAPMANQNPAEKDNYLKEIEYLGDLEIRRIASEVALIAAAHSRDKPDQQGYNLVFNAQVGVIQTGAGSFGIANQHIDQGASKALTEALAKIHALATADDDPQRNDVLDLVADTRAELEKEKPNQFKVKSLVSGLGDALSLMPKMKEAYDALKWAGTLVGVNLP
ncbi:hypothetical protein [Rhizobium etli]|uniref:Uncharacterized protein n=1 Tax=Rhizobium etli TaxID=29449 RepID=A0A7W6VC39_RHIET|nr:hypothetical protein [Rhizobium etli]MBB4481518.1 hypothetical protein [Rhizobium etli]MBB4537347.1 hypothetical protein [Rhizobium etli]